MLLVATKPMRYATRRLQAGDEFTALNPRDGKLLIAARKAKAVTERPVGELPPPPASLVEKVVAPAPVVEPPADDMAALRAEYHATIGRRPFPGWSADVLRQKIADAREAE